MRRFALMATLLVMGLALAASAAEEGKGKTQSKTGEVKKVDAAAKQIVVMVARELTFAVTDATKIVQGDKAMKLSDIKVGTQVTVEYSREGDARMAVKIEILGEKSKERVEK